jgi:Rrf2 family iron-sulfur cluster assembly transcriptional regulator
LTVFVRYAILLAMKLTKRARYAVTALFDLAHAEKAGLPTAISQISKRQGISVDYLEQILNKLRREGLVASVRGPRGGYRLAKKPSHIKVGDIINVIEGPVALVACAGRKMLCRGGGCCSTRLLWQRLATKVEKLLASISLKDLCKELG